MHRGSAFLYDVNDGEQESLVHLALFRAKCLYSQSFQSREYVKPPHSYGCKCTSVALATPLRWFCETRVVEDGDDSTGQPCPLTLRVTLMLYRSNLL